MIVEDLTQNSIFRRTAALEVLLDAGVRAVRSTPLIAWSGLKIGLLSTHGSSPCHPRDRVLSALDLLAKPSLRVIGYHRLFADLNRRPQGTWNKTRTRVWGEHRDPGWLFRADGEDTRWSGDVPDHAGERITPSPLSAAARSDSARRRVMEQQSCLELKALRG